MPLPNIVQRLTRRRENENDQLRAEVGKLKLEVAQLAAKVELAEMQRVEADKERRITEAKIRELQVEIAIQDAEKKTLLDEWDHQMSASDKGEPLRPLSSVSRVRKMPKSAFVGAAESAPQAVWTEERDPKADKEKYKFDGSRDKKPEASEFKKRLIAPVAGFLSAGLEITIVWPSEYAKTQLQLNKSNADFRIMRHMMNEGLSIYKGLTPMLIGAPIQVRTNALRFFRL